MLLLFCCCCPHVTLCLCATPCPQWYRVDMSQVSPEHSALFVPLSADAQTEEFLAQCHEKSDWLFTQLWHTLVKSILTLFMTQTSVNG